MTNEELNIFLNSLNAKEGLYRIKGDKDLEFYFRKAQDVIYELKQERSFEKCNHCMFNGGQACDKSKCSRCTSNPNHHDKFQSNDPVDDSVVYGKIDGLGHLIHTSELGNVEGGLFDDI